jgi:hypothetical protein
MRHPWNKGLKGIIGYEIEAGEDRNVLLLNENYTKMNIPMMSFL